MKQPPKRKEENILTRPMLWTILTTAVFFIVVMIILLIGMEGSQEKPGWFAGTGNWSREFPELTTRQVSIFFSIYVFFQVWNQINCRSLTPRESGLKGLFGNPTFLAIAGSVAVVQILIVSLPSLGDVFKVEPLGFLDWLWIIAGTAVVLAFSEAARLVRRALVTP